MVQHQVHAIGPFELEDAGVVFAEFTTLETITEADAVYVNSSGRIGRARADASSTMHAIGAAFRGIASGLLGRVVTQGLLHSANYNFSGGIGRFGYVSTSAAGGVQITPPSASGQLVQVIGHIRNSSGLYVAIQGAFQRGQTL